MTHAGSLLENGTELTNYEVFQLKAHSPSGGWIFGRWVFISFQNCPQM